MASMVLPYLAAAIIGLVHGLEPGHGWPVAVYYSLNKEKRILYGLITSGILVFFHFISSMAVVALFLLFNRTFNLTSYPIMRYVAFILLTILAVRAWFEHPHSVQKKKAKSLLELASYAFVLGFVHEEEFAILAFCIAGSSCLWLMITYAAAVSIALIGITLLSIKSYSLIEPKIMKYDKYIPKIISVVLFVIALSYLFRF